MIEELIVVEGKNDAHAVRRALGPVDILWTEGYGLSKEKLDYIAEMAKRRGVIVFTDPDSVGEQIRNKIRRHVPTAKHVYLSKRDARSKDNSDIGVENASPEDIRKAFAYIQEDVKAIKGMTNFDINDLIKLGLTGKSNSKELRLHVGKKLGIGDANAKQFIQRLNRFGIERSELEKVVWEVANGERL